MRPTTQKLGATLKLTPRGITIANKPLPERFPTENLLTLMLPVPWYPMPGTQMFIWAFATPAQAKKYHARLRADAAKGLWTFQPASLLMGTDPINDIWRPSRKPPVGAIAHLRVGLGTKQRGEKRRTKELEFLYVDMMSVHPKWRRLGLNTAILLQLLHEWPTKRLIFSKTTHAGQAFAEAWRRAGRQVEVEGERSKIRLLEES